MWLERLTLSSIRSYEYAVAKFSPGMTILFGSNGSGKTTILEAISLLGTLKSFRTPFNQQLLTFNRTEGVKGEVKGFFQNPSNHTSLTLHTRGKVLHREERTLTNIPEFIGDLRVVVLAPEHQNLISGSGEERRKYIDRILFSLNPNYLETSQKYARALKQKQALLRQEVSWSQYEDLSHPWNQELIRFGEPIRKARRELVETILPEVQKKQKSIAPRGGEVQLTYKQTPLSIEEEINQKKKAEHSRCRSLVGPHRDDLEILFNERPIGEIASQGERTTVLLALKLAELGHIEEETQNQPILLLDDLGATLDHERQTQLLHLLQKGEYQVVVTTADDRVLQTAIAAGATPNFKKIKAVEGGFSIAHWGAA